MTGAIGGFSLAAQAATQTATQAVDNEVTSPVVVLVDDSLTVTDTGSINVDDNDGVKVNGDNVTTTNNGGTVVVADNDFLIDYSAALGGAIQDGVAAATIDARIAASLNGLGNLASSTLESHLHSRTNGSVWTT
ncbi:hypothetical protein GCM10009127_13150 [Alteraurantiacibacter aestuarii]|uniref:Uncharacterized protein n=1 Tax=Alteraurantiacibacter aestuarii TaxID=650004 RepID=A0A844ZJX3_9SPHN|nr:hypothetical protein [Alteraurantiacibacter aestuarii]MXO88095.1 hypothetical protein [Alteraurantiacibacter aestuarii]